MKPLALIMLLISPVLAGDPVEIQLWPEGAEEPAGFTVGEETEPAPKREGDTLRRLTNVSDPTLTVYPAEGGTGTAVVVCPGGGYNILAIEHEGTQVCEFLNGIGVTAALLKYRVPRRDKNAPSKWPMQDAHRAIGMLRKRASEWGIERIGILGFSAGGNLAVMTTLHGNDRTYETDPEQESSQTQPDFAIPIYPAYLTSEDGTALLPEIQVTESAPPICLIHAHDDRITAAGSALLYLAYKQLGLSAELHIYEQGGHGFGMKEGDLPVNAWPDRVADWLQARGWAD